MAYKFTLNFWEYPNLEFLIKDVSLPFIKLETETLKSGEKVYIGYRDFDSFTISVNETVGMDTIKFFQDWQDSIFDKATKKFKKGDKTKEMTLTLFDYQLTPSLFNLLGYTEVPTYKFDFKGVKLLGIGEKNFSYEDTSQLYWDIELTCDTIERFLQI